MKDIVRKLLYADEVAVVQVEEWTIVQDICLHSDVQFISLNIFTFMFPDCLA